MEEILLEDETLRDGLQGETRVLSLDEKVLLFSQIREAGLKRIQIGSFVHPTRIPQMRDTDELARRIYSTDGVLLTGLILNGQGLERALGSGLTHVSMGVSASDTHSRKNVNQPSDAALSSILDLLCQGKKAGLKIRGGIQCAFGCVYEGRVSEEKVFSFAEAMVLAGADEINLADTTGMGNPHQVRRLVGRLRDGFPGLPISLHLHDTRGLGLANMLAGYEAGVRIFDVCAGGLGGCPFVKGAAGNVPTEDAVHMFEEIGVSTGIDLQAICRIVEKLESLLGRQLPGRMSRVYKGNPC